MVAIFTGSGLGLEASSAWVLGSRGTVSTNASGGASNGRAGEGVWVNAATGNLVLTNRDEFLIGRGPQMGVGRTYNSVGGWDGDNADGWRASGYRRVKLTGGLNAAGSSVTRTDWDGSEQVFAWNADQAAYVWTGGSGAHDRIVREGNAWVWQDGDSLVRENYTLAPSEAATSGYHRLAEARDEDENIVVYGYAGDKLTSVTSLAVNDPNATPHVINLMYAGDNLTSLTTTADEVYTHYRYSYDTYNRLSRVEVDLNRADGSVADGSQDHYWIEYTYAGASDRITQISQEDGSKVTFGYDAAARISWVRQYDNANTYRQTSFAYGAPVASGDSTTTITDALGQVTTMTYDVEGQLIQLTDAAGRVSSFSYAANGDVMLVSDGDGDFVSYRYDANGNVRRERDRAGNTVVREYSTDNRLLREVRYTGIDPDNISSGAEPTGAMVTRYVYDSENHLAYSVSATGNVTAYSYSAKGDLLKSVVYTESRYNVSGLAETAVLLLSQMTAWEASGINRSAAIRTNYSYDHRGNLATTQSWSRLDANGDFDTSSERSMQFFIYDQYGNLLSRRYQGSWQAETYVYDGLQRLTLSTDFAGNQTGFAYLDAERQVSVTYANGRVVTSAFNHAGEVIATSETVSGEVSALTNYHYDALGRVVMVEGAPVDGVRSRSFNVYDESGLLVRQVDATGAVTAFAYGGAGKLMRSVAYANRLSAAQLAGLVTSNGKPNLDALKASAGDTMPAVDSANDRYSWRFYDTAGRLVQSIDRVNVVVDTAIEVRGRATVYDYDGAGRLLSVRDAATLYTTAQVNNWRTNTPLNFALPASHVDDRITRYFYDADGRKVGTLDAEGYLTQSHYDAGGRLHGMTALSAASDVADRASADLATILSHITPDPDADITSWTLYDARGLVRASVDGEGNLMRYGYDQAGRVTLTLRGEVLTAAELAAWKSGNDTAAPTVGGALVFDQTTYSYDRDGRLLNETRDVAGGTETVSYVYDNMGRLIKATTVQSAGTISRSSNWRFDARGRLIGELSGVGSAALAALGNNPSAAQVDAIYARYGVRYEYDNADRLVARRDPVGDVAASEAVRAAGNRTVYYYDANGRLLHEVKADGSVSSLTYNAFGEVVATLTRSNRIASASLAGLTGGLVTSAFASALATAALDAGKDIGRSTSYNLDGTIATVVNALGVSTAFQYNLFGELFQQVDVLSGSTTRTTQFAYDKRGQLSSTTLDSVEGGLALATNYTYDAFGRLTHVAAPDNSVVQTGYDRAGRSVFVVDQLGHQTHYGYDGRGHVVSVTNREGKQTSFSVAAFGRSMQMTTAEGLTTTTAYNAWGETVSVTDGADRTQSWTYTADGQLDVASNAAGSVNQDYDDAGRLWKVTDTRGTVTQYTYDALGRVLSETVDPTGLALTTSYSNDSFGRTLTMTDAAGLVTSFAYDRESRQSAVTVGTGVNAITTQYGYDDAGRLVTITEGVGKPEQRVTRNIYDKAGRITTTIVDDGAGKLNLRSGFAYDTVGNLIARTEALGEAEARVTRYVYDDAGRLIWQVDALGQLISTSYDDEGRVLETRQYYNKMALTALSPLDLNATGAPAFPVQSTLDRIERFAYDDDGRLTWSVDPLGLVTRRVYDGSNLVTYERRFAIALGASTAVTDTGLKAWALSNSGAADREAAFVYDTAGRLEYSIDSLGAVVRMHYDGAGNAVQQTAYAAAYAGALTGATKALLDSFGTAQASNAGNRITRMAYDKAGRMTTEVAADGAVTQFSYDAMGRVLVSKQFATLYPAAGAITAATAFTANAADRVTLYRSDALGRMQYTLDAEGYLTRYSYDALGNVKAETRFATQLTASAVSSFASSAAPVVTVDAANDRTINYAYDSAGRLSQTTDGEGYVTKYTLDSLGQVGRIDYAFGTADVSVTTRAYDVLGRITSETVGFGSTAASTTIYGYTNFNEVETVTYGFGSTAQSVTSYSYDARGQMLSETRGEGSQKADGSDASVTRDFTYTLFGELETEKDGRGFVTSYTYDEMGRVLSKRVPVDGVEANTLVTSYSYNAFGDMVRMTDPSGGVGVFYHDKMGRVTTQVDPELYVTRTVYNAFGDIASVTRYETRLAAAPVVGTVPVPVLTTGHDATTSFGYDKRGLLTQSTDALGAVSSTAYNGFGERASETNALGGVFTYAYDQRGLLVSQTMPGVVAASTTATPGAAGAVITTTYAYDGRGNRTQMMEAAGRPEARTTAYVYDAQNRMTATSLIGSANVLADGLGTGSGSTVTTLLVESLRYDTLGRVIERMDGAGARILMSYDALGRMTASLAANGAYTAMDYDANGNVLSQKVYDTAVGLPATGWLEFPPAPTGPTATVRATSFTYDGANRLLTTSIANVLTGSHNGSSWTSATGAVTTFLEYDRLGNVIEQKDGEGNTIVTWYDALGRRVAQRDQEGYVKLWTLDSDGNVTKEVALATARPALWRGSARATVEASATSANDRVTEFTYDRAGRRLTESRLNVAAWSINGSNGVLTEAASTASTVTFSYNALGQVTSREEANGDVTNYVYDTAGRLIKEIAAGYSAFVSATSSALQQRQTQYVYNGLGNLAEQRVGQVGGVAANDRVSSFGYDAYGRMTSESDAMAFTKSYAYDGAGRVTRISYARTTSNGSMLYEAIGYRYDQAGQLVAESAGAKASATATSYEFGPVTRMAYNVHGQVTARGLKLNLAATDTWQETMDYDAVGRMWRSTAGDGVTKIMLYDKAGRQSLTLSSAGADLSNMDVATLVTKITSQGGITDQDAALYEGAVTTLTVYDKRGLVKQTRQPERRMHATGALLLLWTSRIYNAFGEVIAETDARNNTTEFSYNSMGRLISRLSPEVNVTAENGLVTQVRPEEFYRYDLSGRMIGRIDANGNATTRTLAAGTGHGGSQDGGATGGDDGLVLKEFHADGGIVERRYDVFGDMRQMTNEISKKQTYAYDAASRLISQTHEMRNATMGSLVDYYAYDELGQRTKHWNNQTGTNSEALAEHTDYDRQGRVIAFTDYADGKTAYEYTWSDSAVTMGMAGSSANYGGWTKTTTLRADLIPALQKSSTETTDYFGRTIAKTDFGGNQYGYSYDGAGRLVEQSITKPSFDYASSVTTFTWFNSGLAAGSVLTSSGTWTTVYGYDRDGNRILEQYTGPNAAGAIRYYQATTAQYDALNRLTQYKDRSTEIVAGTDDSGVTIDYEYDAVGNVRNMRAVYRDIDDWGSATSTTPLVQDYWYKYDSMNRFVTTRGVLTGTRDAEDNVIRGTGEIVRGIQDGVSITYDMAGNRKSATRSKYKSNFIGYVEHIREEYIYSNDGYLDRVVTSTTSQVAQGSGSAELTTQAALATAVWSDVTKTDAIYTRDLLGRVTLYREFNKNAQNAGVYGRDIEYDVLGRTVRERTFSYEVENDVASNNRTSFISNGYDAFGNLTWSLSKNYKDWFNDEPKDTLTVNIYEWGEGARQSQTWFNKDINAGSLTNLSGYPITFTVDPDNTSWKQYVVNPHLFNPNGSGNTSTYNYDAGGRLVSVNINDDYDRTVKFISNSAGQIMRRIEERIDAYGNPTSDAKMQEVHYYLGGMKVGALGNNGTDNVDYATSIAAHTAKASSGAPGMFRGGATTGTSYADFDQSYDAINGLTYQSAAGRYTVNAGDTLQSIAQSVWGDASLWYKLADANGLDGSETLVEGQSLIIPNKLTNIHNNADTFRVYDPNSAIGDNAPTLAKPPKGKKCGTFGLILMAVIAVAVSVWLGPQMIAAAQGLLAGSAGAVVGGAVTGAIASLASQGFGIAIGAQDSINWKGVALSALGGGISAGVAASNTFSGLGKLGSAVARAAVGNAATQGIATATGLQGKFDWTGVATAAVSAGASFGAAQGLGAIGINGGIAYHLGTSMAGNLANAATRSVLTKSNFGDNIIAAIPDTIAQTIGGVIGERMRAAAEKVERVNPLERAREIALSDESLNDDQRLKIASKPDPEIILTDTEMTTVDNTNIKADGRHKDGKIYISRQLYEDAKSDEGAASLLYGTLIEEHAEYYYEDVSQYDFDIGGFTARVALTSQILRGESVSFNFNDTEFVVGVDAMKIVAESDFAEDRISFNFNDEGGAYKANLEPLPSTAKERELVKMGLKGDENAINEYWRIRKERGDPLAATAYQYGLPRSKMSEGVKISDGMLRAGIKDAIFRKHGNYSDFTTMVSIHDPGMGPRMWIKKLTPEGQKLADDMRLEYRGKLAFYHRRYTDRDYRGTHHSLSVPQVISYHWQALDEMGISRSAFGGTPLARKGASKDAWTGEYVANLLGDIFFGGRWGKNLDPVAK